MPSGRGFFIPDGGKDAEGVFLTLVSQETVQDPSVASDEEKAIVARFKARWGHEPAFMGLTEYEAMQVILAGIERAGVKDRAAIITAIGNTKDYNGPFGKWSFLPNGDTTFQPKVSLYVVKDGKIQFVKGLSK